MFHSPYDIEKKGIIFCSRMNADLNSDAYIRDSLERFCGVSRAVIERTPEGKPYDAEGQCSFSLSHSAKLISIYISSLPAVGCDIQRTDRKYSEKEIAAKAFEIDEIEIQIFWNVRNPFINLPHGHVLLMFRKVKVKTYFVSKFFSYFYK